MTMIQLPFKSAKSLKNNCKRVQYLLTIKARSAFFPSLFFVHLFLRTTPNDFWTLWCKLVYVSLPKYFIFLFLSSLLSEYRIWIYVSFNFIHFSHVKLVLCGAYLKMVKECFRMRDMLQNDMKIRLLLSVLNRYLTRDSRSPKKKENHFDIIWSVTSLEIP